MNKEFTQTQVKDIISEIWETYGLTTDNIIESGIHHRLMIILYPEIDDLEGDDYASTMDEIQPESYFPGEIPRFTEHFMRRFKGYNNDGPGDD